MDKLQPYIKAGYTLQVRWDVDAYATSLVNSENVIVATGWAVYAEDALLWLHLDAVQRIGVMSE